LSLVCPSLIIDKLSILRKINNSGERAMPDEMWVVQDKETGKVLGVFTTRDLAIKAGSIVMSEASGANGVEMHAFKVDALAN